MGRGNNGRSYASNVGASLRSEPVSRIGFADLGDGAAAFGTIRSISVVDDTNFEIIFNDGTQVDVDVENVCIASNAASEEQLAAALYAATARYAFRETSNTTDEDHPLLALGDVASMMIGADEQLTELQIAAIISESQKVLADRAKGVAIDNAVTPLVEVEAPAVLTPRVMKREFLRKAGARIREIKDSNAGITDDELAREFVMGMNATQMSEHGIFIAEEDAQREVERLGMPVPNFNIKLVTGEDEDGRGVNVSVGSYYCGDEELIKFQMVRNALMSGDRAFAFRGPPGTGKDSFAREVAAMTNRVYVQINLGPTADLEQAIGGDGLVAKTVKVERQHIVDGKPVTITEEQVVTASETQFGPLTTAIQGPNWVNISEPEGHEDTLVRVHSIAGDTVGAPDKRTLTISSTSGEKALSVPVHPEAVICFTFNPGIDDFQLGQALSDRMVNLDFDVPEIGERCERQLKMVEAMLGSEMSSIDDGLKNIGLKADDIRPIVEAMDKLAETTTRDHTFIQTPGERTTARFITQLAIASWYGNKVNTAESDVESVLRMLDFTRSYEARANDPERARLIEIIRDEKSDIGKLSRRIKKLGMASRGDVEEPVKAAAKPKPKAKPKAKPKTP